MEKQRGNLNPDDNSEPESECAVTIMSKTVSVKMKDKELRANDLIRELRVQHKDKVANFKFNSTVKAVLNGKPVKLNDRGEIEGNPIITEGATLVLIPNLAGGIDSRF